MRVLSLFVFFALFSSGLSAQASEKKLDIIPLTGDFYVYTTYNYYKGSRIGANGMYLVTNDGVVIFDSPWDTTQFQPLLDSIRVRHGKPVVICIATHFHEDRTAGLEYFRQKGIKTFTTVLTDELSGRRGMKRAEYLLQGDSVFNVGEYSFQAFYPGEGHAPDNIVIWFKKQEILYGGCLVKSVLDNSLGNLGDANTKAYAATLRKLRAKCGDAKFIIPGHNDWTDAGSLNHTLKMAEALER